MSEHLGELISQYLDGEIRNEAEKAMIEEHLSICPQCQQQLNGYIAIREQLTVMFDRIEIPDRLEDKVLAKIHQASIQQYFWAAIATMLGFGLVFLLISGPLLRAGLHISQTAFSIARGLTYAFPSILGAIPNMVAVASIFIVVFIIIALAMLRYLVHTMGKTPRAEDI